MNNRKLKAPEQFALILHTLNAHQEQQAAAFIVVVSALVGALVARGTLDPELFVSLLKRAEPEIYNGSPPQLYRDLVDSIAEFSRDATKSI